MGIMVYSLLWVMQDLHHQPYYKAHQSSMTCGPDHKSKSEIQPWRSQTQVHVLQLGAQAFCSFSASQPDDGLTSKRSP